MSDKALIIFVKNPEKGKVKTRLAADIGEDKALEVYQRLLEHTCNETKDIEVEKYVYYGDELNWNDLWTLDAYNKRLQVQEGLGERIKQAIADCQSAEHEKVVVIGSDSAEITQKHIKEAFFLLNENDVVIGPAKDGGYYLIGVSGKFPEIFEDIDWSTDKVFDQTLDKIRGLKLKHGQLEALSDVDHVTDVPDSWL